MSAEVPITLSLPDAHRHAIDDLNRWRGHCIEAFARLEEAAAATIAYLSLPTGVKRPTVFGERVKVLKALLGDRSDKHSLELVADLNKLGDDLNLRNRIVHAAGAVYVDRKGGWLWSFRFQPSKAGAELERGTLDQKEGHLMEKRLSYAIRSLTSRLETIRTP